MCGIFNTFVSNDHFINQNMTNKDKAYELWGDFIDSVLYKNRFFIEHEVLNILKEAAEKQTLEIPAGNVMFRARIIDDTAKSDYNLIQAMDKLTNDAVRSADNDFFGLNKSGSFVPTRPEYVGEGRANPKLIRYLYVSESPVTTLLEVRPTILDRVNIADIRNNSPLIVANLSVEYSASDELDDTISNYILKQIQYCFSTPTTNTNIYIPSQIIAEYIKKLGYDGLRFRSSLHKQGYNLTIFNYENCEPIKSREFSIENIKISARSVSGSAWGRDSFWFIKDNTIQQRKGGANKIYEYISEKNNLDES